MPKSMDFEFENGENLKKMLEENMFYFIWFFRQFWYHFGRVWASKWRSRWTKDGEIRGQKSDLR